MRCTNETVQMQICTTILQIYTNKSPGNEVQRLCPCSYQFSRMIVERSDVSETLVKVSLNSLMFVNRRYYKFSCKALNYNISLKIGSMSNVYGVN